MGQVAIDLPDPLNNSGPAGPGVDDLLAQLAGEEIDRLLAEAEIERPAKAVEVMVPPGAVNVAADEPVVVEMKPQKTAAQAPGAGDPEKLSSENEALSPPAGISEAGVEELDARVAQELNNLFSELNSDNAGTGSAAESPAEVEAAEMEAAVAVEAMGPSIPAAPSDPMAQAQALEQQLLSKTLMDALGGPEVIESAPSRMKTLGFSLLLKPLEWANAPLAACSDTVRGALGKVAILTLINALAILLYVVFLRKH